MPGNEQRLVPDVFGLLLYSYPPHRQYLDAEGYAGAKRGGSPNLAKLANAGRLLDMHFGITKNFKKLKFPDPNREFAEWMKWEIEKGFMWNEQGPSPNYDWMHLLPTIAFVVFGKGEAKTLAEDWCRMFFKALCFGLKGDAIAQVGMRAVGHMPDDDFNRWMIEYLRTGIRLNRYWKKHFVNNEMASVLMVWRDTLAKLVDNEPVNKWKVRQPQHWYHFDNLMLAILEHDGNGNTQARAMDMVSRWGKRVMFPRDGGHRKQGKLDKMTCRLVQNPDNSLVVKYDSEMYGKDFEVIEGTGRLVSHVIWDSAGLRTTHELFETINAPGQREADQPMASVSEAESESKGWFRRFLEWIKGF